MLARRPAFATRDSEATYSSSEAYNEMVQRLGRDKTTGCIVKSDSSRQIPISSSTRTMTRFLVLLLCLLLHTCSARSTSLFFFHQFSPTSPDGSWLWAWVWGAESSVSVVDRSPPLTFRSRPAAFGPELDDPLLGYVLPLSSFTTPCPTTSLPLPNTSNSACPPLCHIGPHRPDPKEPWIALVQRGDCPFVDKEGLVSSHPTPP